MADTSASLHSCQQSRQDSSSITGTFCLNCAFQNCLFVNSGRPLVVTFARAESLVLGLVNKIAQAFSEGRAIQAHRRAGHVSWREPASEEAKLMACLLDSNPSLEDPTAKPAPCSSAFGMPTSSPCSQPQTLGGLCAILLPPLLIERGRRALSCNNNIKHDWSPR